MNEFIGLLLSRRFLVGIRSIRVQSRDWNSMDSIETTTLGFGVAWVKAVSGVPLHTLLVIFASFFVAVTLGLSFYLLFQHLSTYSDPSEQRWLIGIICMIPIYSVASFVSLSVPEISLECNILGNCYEAFAMYSFGRYLIACLGEEDSTVIQKLEKQDSIGPRKALLDDHSGYHLVYHPVPFSWFFEPWQLGKEFYDKVKFGIVQYMILKTTCVWLSLVLEQFDVYGEGEFDWTNGYPYITLVLNFSQTWALYCLIQFYQATKKELQAIHPLSKFITFKSVVFLTWWQGVIIAFIFTSGLVNMWFSEKAIFRGNVQTGLQDFIVCLEMSIAAVAHTFVYPAKPYVEDFDMRRIVAKALGKEHHGTVSRVRDSVHDVIFEGGEDVVEDVRITMHQAVGPLEAHMSKIRESYHGRKKSWAAGGRRRKKTVTTTTENLLSADGVGSGAAGSSVHTSVIKETETETETDGTVESDSEPEIPAQSRITTTSDAGKQDDDRTEVFVKSTGRRSR